MAIFPANYERAAALLPGNELHPLRLWKSALLVVTVLNYRATDIGNYIEFSVGLACTHGPKPAPPLLGALFMNLYGTGQFVYDLPVSTEISVKGGKGIWGMPKHQANLSFTVGPDIASSRYDKDGRMVMAISIKRPGRLRVPVSLSGVNYSAFRGLLMKSYVYFRGTLAVSLVRPSAQLILGDHPRAAELRTLNISTRPLATAYCAGGRGVLDDHFEGWFLSHARPPTSEMEGLRSVVDLGLGQDWLEPPGPVPEQPDPTRQNELVLTFSETMAGGFALGVMDPERGKSASTRLALHATITIRDVNRFIADPNHVGEMLARLDFEPLGTGIPSRRAIFNLFSPADRPGLKLMVYELAFEAQGKEYYLAGRKEIRDDSGIDLWSDTTTLQVWLHEGPDRSGPVIGSGVLSLGLPELVRMATSMRVQNARSPVEAAAVVGAFGRFFMGALWDSYAPAWTKAPSSSRHPGDEIRPSS